MLGKSFQPEENLARRPGDPEMVMGVEKGAS